MIIIFKYVKIYYAGERVYLEHVSLQKAKIWGVK